MKKSENLLIIVVGFITFFGIIAAATYYILTYFVASNIGVTI